MSVVRTSEQICDEINAVTKKANQYAQKVEDFWDTRKALVKELRQDFPDEWLAELKARCQIGRSQAFKIAAIADGRTTAEKEREKNAEANRRYRSPALNGSIPPSPEEPAVHHDGLLEEGHTAEQSADARRAVYAAAEPSTEVAPDVDVPTDSAAALEQVPPPDARDTEIAGARIAELETTGPRVVLDPANHQCSFCTKSSGEVLALIKGTGGAFICDECVAGAVKILEERAAAKSPVKRRGRPPGSKNKLKAAHALGDLA